MSDARKREERPATAARRITKTNVTSKNTRLVRRLYLLLAMGADS